MVQKARAYNWDTLPKEVVRPGVSRSGFRGDNVLLVMNWLEPGMEEASWTLGRSPWQPFRRVTLPLLYPAIGAGALLVALYTLSDFGAVALLQYDTFTRVIFNEYNTAFNRAGAAARSREKLCGAGHRWPAGRRPGTVWGCSWMLGRRGRVATELPPGRPRRPRRCLARGSRRCQ